MIGPGKYERFQRYAGSAECRGAVHHWRESLRLDPRHDYAARTHVMLGEYAAAKLGDARAAAADYRAALAIDPSYGDALLDLAGLHRKGAPDEAQIVSRAEALAALDRVLAEPRADARQRAIAQALRKDLGAE